jgi:G:T-mismatch repair DNA endonuclease (very short patch repair protein)
MDKKYGATKNIILTNRLTDEKLILPLRNICTNCFIKEHDRLPKKPNISNYDMIYFWKDYELKIKEIIKSKSITKKFLIKKYGEIEGIKKWNSYCKKQSITNTFEYKNKKYGMNKEEFDNYNKSRSVTKINLIKRHGEIKGIKKWNSYCKKQSYVGVKLEYFIEKYGEIEGIKKWKQYTNKIKPFYSKISQECFWKIYDEIKDFIDEDKIYFAEKNKEFRIFSNNKVYFYDFVISNLKICIEFHGDIFHGNPEIYNENDTPNPFIKNLTVKEMNINDKYKENIITNRGFKYFIIWERDYKKYKLETINLIIKKIKDIINESN